MTNRRDARSKKDFARRLVTLPVMIFVVMSVLVVGDALAQQSAGRPNVVLMLADNLGYGDLGVYNQGIRGIPTPRIDQLAAEGMRLTQFLVEAGCTPSRAGLLTGRLSVRTGLSLIIMPGGKNTLQESEFTLGEMFKSAGYHTAYFGKWHLDAESKSQPQNQGFDEWRVGFSGTTDVTLYAENMKQAQAPVALREAMTYSIVEASGPGEAKVVRPYDLAYRKQIEGDIAAASITYIQKQAAAKQPFFTLIGWTRPHYPNDVSAEFVGKSRIGTYGDSVAELDYRTGQVLDAIKAAGIENNTIVIFISDNGPTTTGGMPQELYAGDPGPFRGELGDAYEGSIRTVGIIKWPEKIAPQVSNEMVAIHDFLPTLASIVDVKMPGDRPIDGVDQSAFLYGKQAQSNRDTHLTIIGDRLVAVRWKQWRIYPVEFLSSRGNPAGGGYIGTIRETAGYPQIYNIEADPKEQVNVAHLNGWVLAAYLRTIEEYRASLKKFPNPPAPSITDVR